MSYSFDMCLLFGEIYLSDNKKGCILILLPDKKQFKLYAIYLDLKLALFCIGIKNIKKAIDKENKIKQLN